MVLKPVILVTDYISEIGLARSHNLKVIGEFGETVWNSLGGSLAFAILIECCGPSFKIHV